MRNVLVVTMECPVPPVEKAFSFEYGFPRTALLLASCIQEWGEEKGLTPIILNLDEKLRAKRNELGSIIINNETVFDEILAKTINIKNPELVCIVAPYTRVANWAIRAAVVSKTTNPESLVITGGAHASFVSNRLINPNNPIFDAVILGPGEAKLKHILDNFDNPQERFRHPGIATPETPVVFSIKSQQNNVRIPPIDYSLIPKEEMGDGGTIVMAGRGCPNACQFCLESTYWRKASVHYSQNASFVRNEIIDLTNLNVPVFGLGDSLIDMRTIGNKISKFENFCHEALDGLKLHEHFSLLTRLHMIEEKGCRLFKEAGGKAIWVGIETANKDLLTAMGKGEIPYIIESQLWKAKRSGIRVGAFFMFGFPGETPKSAKETLVLIENLFKAELLDYVDLSIFVPYPGLSLYDDQKHIIRREPEWNNWDNWGRYNKKPVYDLQTISSENIFQCWKEAIAMKVQYDIREIQRTTSGGKS